MLDNAISLYQKALAITEDLQNYNLAAIIVSNISILYNETGKNNEAIQISRKMFTYPQTDTLTIDYRIGEVNRLCNHAILLANNQQPVQAMDTLKRPSRNSVRKCPTASSYWPTRNMPEYRGMQESPGRRCNTTGKP